MQLYSSAVSTEMCALYLCVCVRVCACFIFFQNYFEELVCVRDNQLRHLESQHRAAMAEGVEQRKQLETVILELQQQL